MKSRILGSCLLVMICLLAAIPATAATPLPLPPVWPSTWVNTVDDPGMTPPSLFPESYVATANETGMITDLYVVGDSYTVFVNGLAVLTTPVVPSWTTYPGCTDGHTAPCPFTADPNVAWADPLNRWSKGSFALHLGDIVTIQENSLPPTFTDGTYAITATTPEPGTLVMFGSAILGLAGVFRRKISL